MDLTAPKVAEIEHFDSPEVIDQLATTLAENIRAAKHFIAFTGAGVSTSAGIPDFRGPQGAWTLRAQGKEVLFKGETTLQAIPTPTHMALVELQQRGILKYLVSQNCDGLHRRSGILPDKISELHGNSNLEYCKACGKEYLRDYRAVASFEKSINDHRTGRKCSRCDGILHDTIVNFGEDLPKRAFSRAHDNAKKADLCLVLGSSLRVQPANSIPEIVARPSRKTKNKNKLVICNLQTTPLDNDAHMLIRTRTDYLMIRTMAKLGFEIPRFILRRQLVVEVQTQSAERHQLKVYGIDVDGTPVTFLKSAKLEGSRRVAKSEPYIILIRDKLDSGSELKLELEFMGHYLEPRLTLTHEFIEEEDRRSVYLMEYDPQQRFWSTSRLSTR